jgi:hypothetical protein
LGPKPSHIIELSDTGRDHNNLQITKTYCLKSVHIPGKKPAPKPGLVYDYGIDNHVFSDRAEKVRISAKDGWVRVEQTRIPADRRKWKRGRRDREPENEPFSLDKLQKRLDAQLHAGSMPGKTCRRLSIAKRACKLMDARAKLKRKAARITGACQELRARAKAA